MMKNDLKVVTIFMILVFVLLGGLEVRPQDIGHVKPSSPLTPPPDDNQTLNMTTSEVLSRSGYTSEGQGSSLDFTLDFLKVTMVEAKLDWTDDYGTNDVFRLEVAVNGEVLGQDEGSAGGLTVKADAANDKNLAGNYTITVTCVSAPGLVGPSPVDRDRGNSWDLSVSATHTEEGSP